MHKRREAFDVFWTCKFRYNDSIKATHVYMMKLLDLFDWVWITLLIPFIEEVSDVFGVFACIRNLPV